MGSDTTAQVYTHGAPRCTGVLVTNLGTPDAATAPALRRYLREFLSDRRVVDAPRWIWLPVLHGIILRTRPRRSARLYARVWTEEGSPLLAIARRQAAALQKILAERAPGRIEVALGMRYGSPSIAGALESLRAAGARRILVFPLYPQYAAATTASTFDAVAAVLRTWRWIPELRMIAGYHDDPGYIQALARSVRMHWEAKGRGERLLFSFHGIPRRDFEAGDPYHCHCHATARLVAAELGLPEGAWQVAFQSRFGPRKWLEPYTDLTLRQWAREGLRSVDVICPGFAADCLETLEEIQILNAAIFSEAGGGRLSYIAALNDRSDHIEALAALALRHMAGWPEAPPGWNADDAEAARLAESERARQMGAPDQAQATNGLPVRPGP